METISFTRRHVSCICTILTCAYSMYMYIHVHVCVHVGGFVGQSAGHVSQRLRFESRSVQFSFFFEISCLPCVLDLPYLALICLHALVHVYTL